MRGASRIGLVSVAFALLVALGCGSDSAGPPPPPAVDVTGSWDVLYDPGGFWILFGTADLFMAPDGTVTGTLDTYTVTGSVSGYNVSFTIDDGSGYTVTLTGTVDPSGAVAVGTWIDSNGDSGDWDAMRG